MLEDKQTKNYTMNLCEGSILNKLLLFSLPLMASSMLQLFFNASDVAVVGQFAGKNSLAAVGSNGSIINLLTNAFMGLSIGANVLVARYFAAKKEEKLKRFGSPLYVSPSTGLMALVETRYKFIVFGKSQYACVYRIADLASYELEQEKVKSSKGKEETKHYCHLFFHNVAGLYDFRFEVSGELEFKELENYFNKLFGIEKTIGNSINNAKKQWEAIKDMAGAVKAAATGAEDVEEKAQAAYDSLSTYLEGDRTKLIEMADIALSSVRY